jgi:branched-chain amino acid aminotransferase
MSLTFPTIRTSKSRLKETDFDHLPFGKIFSDHMFVAECHNKKWDNFRIMPYGPLNYSPALAVFHYGQAVFEGMKAYRSPEGEILFFRPDENYNRMIRSSERLCMPEIPSEVFYHGLNELVKVDQDWIPKGAHDALYIRPVFYAVDEVIGVKSSENYHFVILTCPTGPYYTGELKVRIETTYSRASRSGTGYAKAAGNYAGALYPTQLANKAGYNQVIWTDAATNTMVEESGTMNLMFVINDVLITPSLSASKLAGVTRDSILHIAKHWGMEVEERNVKLTEIVEALENGTMQEAFGTGTAANVAPIHVIGFQGRDYELPKQTENAFGKKVSDYLADLKNGRVEDPFGWIYTGERMIKELV